jgi:hypothetical protein
MRHRLSFQFKGLMTIVSASTARYFSDLAGSSIFESVLLPILTLTRLGYPIWWTGTSGVILC